MTDSDAPTDRDDADSDAGVSRRTTDDGSGAGFDAAADESNAAVDADDIGVSYRPTDDGSESGVDASQRAGSSETEDAAGTDRSDGQVVPRAAGENDESEADPTDAAVTREPEPIEPETPRAENAVFVLLGVFGTIALLATAIVPGAF